MKFYRRWLQLALALGSALSLGLLWSVTIGGTETNPSPLSDDAAGRGVPPPRAVVEPALGRLLVEEDDDPLRVIVTLHPRPGGNGEIRTLTGDPGDTYAWIVEQRTELFQRREGIAALLDEAARRGALMEERRLWIVQSLAIHGSPALIRQLMGAPGVSSVRLDHYRSYVDPVTTSLGLVSVASTPSSWGVGKIRAPEVWRTLGISGTGAVVAIMDTGVEYRHPALATQYRGRLGDDRFSHLIAWYDPVNGGHYPYDDHGHGTHVTGSAVGQASIGVAPGSQWIGVKVLNGAGSGYDSWILEGFQWLLAPGGDPSLVPDVVNASWSSQNSLSTLFEESIHTLHDAGIFPVFASGNNGPVPESVGSPASNRGVFSVGASDPDDAVTYFSGRGPSPWGEIKPQVVAPGVNILSSIPGGIYVEGNGTSMAAPHAAGLGALLRAVSPTISVRAMVRTLTETAMPLTHTVPNHDSGWGRIDAYAAVLAVSHPSLLTGTVTRHGGGALAGVEVEAIPVDTSLVPGRPNRTTTGDDGDYRMALVPGLYAVTARSFGYITQRAERIPVLTDTVQRIDFQLTARPTGTLNAQVLVSGTSLPPTLPLQARVLATPLSVTVGPGGLFTFSAPEGVYGIELRGNGYRVATATVAITVGDTTELSMVVEPAPQLILVDEGTAYYGSEIALWRGALDALRYAYDLYEVKPGHTPVSRTLLAYDVVLWSSPYGSPGLVAAGAALKGYLDEGGKLLLSGQDVAYYDGGGSILGPGVKPYLYDLMGILYSSERMQSEVLGAGIFAGLQAPIQGSGGADNQIAPDTIRFPHLSPASRIWRYGDGSAAGAATSICVPFRSLFFGFGYEAIADEVDRLTVMDRSLTWLMEPPLTAGLSLAPGGDPIQIGRSGERVTHTLWMRHLGIAGPTDTLTLSVGGSAWPATLSPTHATLSPCGSLRAHLVVTIPTETGVDVRGVTTAVVRSALAPAGEVVTLTSKTPAPILLVDDDRWYPMEDHYTRALSVAGFPYDILDTKHNLGGVRGASSPLTETLMRYPFVIWFTGYDWFAPVRDEEASRLLFYVDQGGRLMLTSQSFLMTHSDDTLADLLGVRLGNWVYEPTEAAGVTDHPAGGGWGPVELDYPYQNWSYTVEPKPEAQPIIRGQLGQPIAIAARTPDHEPVPQSLFYAFPLETLPDETRVEVIERGVGWLSPLGESGWSIAPGDAGPGDVLTFTLELRNHGPIPLDVRMTHTLPSGLTAILPVEGGLQYDAMTQHVTWRGPVASGGRVPLTWRAHWVDGWADGLTATVELAVPAWKLAFERETLCCSPSADLSASHWLTPRGDLRVGAPVTLAFNLVNPSPYDLDAGQVSLWVMEGGAPITANAPLTHGWTLSWWQGSLPAETSRTLTLPIQGWDWAQPFRVDALMQDDEGRRWESSDWLTLAPQTCYLPLIFKMYR